MKNIFLKLYIVGCCLFASNVFAQVNIYTENFDADSLNLPAGWLAPKGGWVISQSNPSTGYNNASGVSHVSIANDINASGDYELLSKYISTKGFTNITMNWGARLTLRFKDSGSAVVGLYWTIDSGANWNQVNYIENTNDSKWALDNSGNTIKLSDSVSNRDAIRLKWLVKIVNQPSGTYKIDDLKVEGEVMSGLEKTAQMDEYIVRVYEKKLFIQSEKKIVQLVKIYNMEGREMISSGSAIADLSALASGIYIVTIYDVQGGVMYKKIYLE